MWANGGYAMLKSMAINVLKMYGVTSNTNIYTILGIARERSSVGLLDECSAILEAYCVCNAAKVKPLSSSNGEVTLSYYPLSEWAYGKDMPMNLRQNNLIYILELGTRVYMNVGAFLKDKASTRVGWRHTTAGKKRPGTVIPVESVYLFYNKYTNRFSVADVLSHIGDGAYCPKQGQVKKLVPGNFAPGICRLGFDYLSASTYIWMSGNGEQAHARERATANLPNVRPVKLKMQVYEFWDDKKNEYKQGSKPEWNPSTKEYTILDAYTLSDFTRKSAEIVNLYSEDPELLDTEEQLREAGFEILRPTNMFDVVEYRTRALINDEQHDDVLDIDAYLPYFILLLKEHNMYKKTTSMYDLAKKVASFCEQYSIEYVSNILECGMWNR
jgi:hypothetical protein